MTIRGKTLKNRILTAPSNHGHIIDVNHQLNMEGVLITAEKPAAGAAMVTLGEALLDHGNSSAHASHIDLTDESCLPNLHRLTRYDSYVPFHGIHRTLITMAILALPQYCHGKCPWPRPRWICQTAIMSGK